MSGAIFMTTELSRPLPTILLEGSLKVSWDAVPGFKSNVLRCLESVTEALFAFFVSSAYRAQSFAGLMGLHAALTERRCFTPRDDGQQVQDSLEIVGLACNASAAIELLSARELVRSTTDLWATVTIQWGVK
jgi:hypothetical protein